MHLSEQFEDHEKELRMVWLSVKSQVVGQLIPVFLKWGKALETIGLQALKLNKDGSLMRVAWASAIWAIAVKLPGLISLMRGFAASTLLPLAGLVLMALAAEDLLTWFQGGDSVIGRFFDIFDTRIGQAAVLTGEAAAFMVSSWEAFGQSLMVVPSGIGMALLVVVNEIASATNQVLAFFEDKIRDLINLVKTAWSFVTTGGDGGVDQAPSTVGRDREIAAAEARRVDLGKQFTNELEGNSSWTDYLQARKTAQLNAGPSTTPGIPESTPWRGMIEATAPVPVAHGAQTHIADNSKTEVHVTVPGTTPATIAAKTGAAVAKATKTDYHGAGMSLEHTVD
jgi:hypothetical protein